jgi:hypothetical protein
VGLRAWFFRQLARGSAKPLDPDEWIEIDVVDLPNGPFVVAVLEREGIAAAWREHYAVATRTVARAQIVVRRADAERAIGVVRAMREP